MLTEASSYKQATARSRQNVFSGMSDEPRGFSERSGFLNIGTHSSLNGALPSIYSPLRKFQTAFDFGWKQSNAAGPKYSLLFV